MGKRIAFIGGGNMASAIIGGLIRQGFAASQIDVVEPWDEARTRLQADFGITAQPEAGAFLASADLIVWAVKPQTFKDAAAAVAAHNTGALHLSVAAGIPSDSIATWLGSERIIRTMPNTPALIGKGITALYARPAVTQADKDWARRGDRHHRRHRVADGRGTTGRRHCHQRLGPGLYVLFHGSHDRGRRPDGPGPGAGLQAGRGHLHWRR
jgi:hypothetical protein